MAELESLNKQQQDTYAQSSAETKAQVDLYLRLDSVKSAEMVLEQAASTDLPQQSFEKPKVPENFADLAFAAGRLSTRPGGVSKELVEEALYRPITMGGFGAQVVKKEDLLTPEEIRRRTTQPPKREGEDIPMNVQLKYLLGSTERQLLVPELAEDPQFTERIQPKIAEKIKAGEPIRKRVRAAGTFPLQEMLEEKGIDVDRREEIIKEALEEEIPGLKEQQQEAAQLKALGIPDGGAVGYPSRIVESNTMRNMRVIGGLLDSVTMSMSNMATYATVYNPETGKYEPVDPSDPAYRAYERGEEELKEAYANGGDIYARWSALVNTIDTAGMPLEAEERFDPEKTTMLPPTGDLLLDAGATMRKGDFLGTKFMRMPMMTKMWEDLGYSNGPLWVGVAASFADPTPFVAPKVPIAMVRGAAKGAEAIAEARGATKAAQAARVVQHPLWQVRNYNAFRAVEPLVDEVYDFTKVDNNLSAVAADNVANNYVNNPSMKAGLQADEGTRIYASIIDNAEETLTSSLKNAEETGGFTNNAFDLRSNLALYASQITGKAPKALQRSAADVLWTLQNKPGRLGDNALTTTTSTFLKELSRNSVHYNRFKQLYLSRNLTPQIQTSIVAATGGDAWRFLNMHTMVRTENYDEARNLLSQELRPYLEGSDVSAEFGATGSMYRINNGDDAARIMTNELGASKVAASPYWSKVVRKVRGGDALNLKEYNSTVEALQDGILSTTYGARTLKPKYIQDQDYAAARLPPERRRDVLGKGKVKELALGLQRARGKILEPVGGGEMTAFRRFTENAEAQLKDPTNRFLQNVVNSPNPQQLLANEAKATINSDPDGMLPVMQAIYGKTLPKSLEDALRVTKVPDNVDALEHVRFVADDILTDPRITQAERDGLRARRRTYVGLKSSAPKDGSALREFVGTGLKETEALTQGTLAYILEARVQKPAIARIINEFIVENPDLVVSAKSKQMVDQYLEQIFRGGELPTSINTSDIAYEMAKRVFKDGEERLRLSLEAKYYKDARQAALSEIRESEASLRELRKITDEEKRLIAEQREAGKVERAEIRAETQEKIKDLNQRYSEGIKRYQESIKKQRDAERALFLENKKVQDDEIKKVEQEFAKEKGEAAAIKAQQHSDSVAQQMENAAAARMAEAFNSDDHSFMRILTGFRKVSTEVTAQAGRIRDFFPNNAEDAVKAHNEYRSAAASAHGDYIKVRKAYTTAAKEDLKKITKEADDIVAKSDEVIEDALRIMREDPSQADAMAVAIQEANRASNEALGSVQAKRDMRIRNLNKEHRQLYDTTVDMMTEMSGVYVTEMRALRQGRPPGSTNLQKALKDLMDAKTEDALVKANNQKKALALQFKVRDDALKEQAKNFKKSQKMPKQIGKKGLRVEREGRLKEQKAAQQQEIEQLVEQRKGRQATVDEQIQELKDKRQRLRGSVDVLRTNTDIPAYRIDVDAEAAEARRIIESRAGQSLRDLNAYVVTSGTTGGELAGSAENLMATWQKLGETNQYLPLTPQQQAGFQKMLNPDFVQKLQKSLPDGDTTPLTRLGSGFLTFADKTRRQIISGLLGGSFVLGFIPVPTSRYFSPNGLGAPMLSSTTVPGFTTRVISAIPAAFLSMLPRGLNFLTVRRLINADSMSQTTRRMVEAEPAKAAAIRDEQLARATKFQMELDLGTSDYANAEAQAARQGMDIHQFLNTQPGLNTYGGLTQPRYTTATGVEYSNYDLIRMVREEEFANQVTFNLADSLGRQVIQASGRDKLFRPVGGLRRIGQSFTSNRDLMNYLNIAGYAMDRVFRENVFLESIMRGYSRSEARILANEALLNYNDVPHVLRHKVAKNAAFMSFRYRMYAETLKAAGSGGKAAENLVRTIRAKEGMDKGLEGYLFPDYTKSRIGAYVAELFPGGSLGDFGLSDPRLEMLVTMSTLGGYYSTDQRMAAVDDVFRMTSGFGAQTAMDVVMQEAKRRGNPNAPGMRVPHTYVNAAAQCARLMDVDCTAEIAEKLGWVPVTGAEARERSYNPTFDGAQYVFGNASSQLATFSLAAIAESIKAERGVVELSQILNMALGAPEGMENLRTGRQSALLYMAASSTMIPGVDLTTAGSIAYRKRLSLLSSLPVTDAAGQPTNE